MATRAPILVTGFEPFGDETLNPSWELARALEGELFGGRPVVVARLPVAFRASLTALRTAVRRHDPALVLALGLAGGRDKLSLERVAINVDDARIPDNAGAQPIDLAIVRSGPAAYFSRLPIKRMLAALRDAGIPAEVSQTAGTYVCNHVFYGLMHALRQRPRLRAGFMHVPYLPEQATRHPGAPCLPFEVQLAGLRIALSAAVAARPDARISGGAEH